MGVPIVYRKTQEPSIASYDYTDIASGTGVTKFYLFATSGATTRDYHLTTDNTMYSSQINTIPAAGFDENFDLTKFNLPRNIAAGTVNINMFFFIAGGSGSGYGTFTLQKVSGSVITTIGSVTTTTEPVPNTGVWSVPITINKTSFKKGDILRLRVQTFTGGSGVPYIGIDPKNRSSGTFIATNSFIAVPFEVDI